MFFFLGFTPYAGRPESRRFGASLSTRSATSVQIPVNTVNNGITQCLRITRSQKLAYNRFRSVIVELKTKLLTEWVVYRSPDPVNFLGTRTRRFCSLNVTSKQSPN